MLEKGYTVITTVPQSMHLLQPPNLLRNRLLILVTTALSQRPALFRTPRLRLLG
jgi:hypothetical protein